MIEPMSFALFLRDATLSGGRELDDARAVLSEEEFRAFYERTSRPLWAYLARITGDRQEADDVLQEAYYRFCRYGGTYESESHRRHTLFAIATNVVRDAARRAKGRKDVPLAADDDAAPLAHPPVAERQAMIRTDVARTMSRLEPIQRELLWLAYAQGASHEEIAGILGLKPVSIRTLLLRARRRFAALLTEKGS
jgi:RNA polymerase sigma-70 factor (ECF subfamily)